MIRIVAENISKSYGNHRIFKNITADFSSGIFGVAGPNGSGKSTLMKCLSGLLRPDSGKIFWKLHDKNLENNERRRQIGFSAPYIRMYPGLSCYENLELVTTLSTGSKNGHGIDEILGTVGLFEKRDAFYGKMSSGQQQRLRLAGALIHNPPVLLFDEPGTNLDKAGSDLLQQLTSRARTDDKLVIIASNNPSELDLCDSVLNLTDYK